MEIANYYVVKPKNPKYTILFFFFAAYICKFIFINFYICNFFLQFLQQSSLYCSSTKKRERKITIRWCFIFDCNRNLLLFFFLCFVFCFVKRERIWELWLVLFIDYFKKKIIMCVCFSLVLSLVQKIT